MTPEHKDCDIEHPILGRYRQTVFDTAQAAGHVELASRGVYGWQMPADAATSYILSQCTGERIMDLGCGLGGAISIPALQRGASLVVAADVSVAHVDDSSLLARFAQENGVDERLVRYWVDANWWWDSSWESYWADLGARDLDMVVARHSMQFGSPETACRVFDLAMRLLKPGGSLRGINFTPCTEYLYEFDDGQTMTRILALNESYQDGGSELPGGYLHKECGPLGLSLKEIIPTIRTDTFIYVDEPTLRGLLRVWREQREMKESVGGLELTEGFYFSPDNITAFNKMVSGDKELHNKENYYFSLRKNL